MPESKPVTNEQLKTEFIRIIQNASVLRSGFLTKLLDPRRDINVECGYPEGNITIDQYELMYGREGVAARVVELMPEDSWSVDPLIFETEDPEKTEFEEAFDTLQKEKNLFHYLHRIDELSGVGRFGVLLLGLSDGGELSDPVGAIGLDGEFTSLAGNELKLLYLRAFDESAVVVASRETDTKNPRYGQPLTYRITFQETVGPVTSGQAVSTTVDGAPIASSEKVVHWSRVIHVADNRKMSETFGTPRMKPVFNRLMDIRKVLSGSAEMFWKGAFPGYSFEVSPEAAADGAKLDIDSLREEMTNFQDGLQRYFAMIGVTMKSQSPQVADPKSHLESQMRYIAISLGVPYRIFLGTEEAKLASSQDVKTWNKRIARRQTKYLAPMVVRPFVDRMIGLGILPIPAEGYEVFWVDLNTVTDEEKAGVAFKKTEALAKYVAGGVDALVPPAEYLKFIMDMEPDEIIAIIEAAIEQEAEMDSDADEQEALAAEEEAARIAAEEVADIRREAALAGE